VCENCWDELMRDHGIQQPQPGEPEREAPKASPLATFLSRVAALLILLTALACLTGVFVRAVQWAWPG
jgi:hypothetical protein